MSRLARVTGFNSCVVRFAARPGVTYRVSADDSGDGGKFRLRARIAKPPPNDDFGAATPIALGTSVQATLRDSSRESGEGAYYFSPFSVWFRLTLGATTTVAVTTSAASSVGCQVFRGDQLKELTPIGAASACFWTAELEPGIYSIQVEGTPSETDFMLSAQAVTPTP